MILSSLKSWGDVKELNKFIKAFKFLEDKDLKFLSIGKHLIDKEKVYATIIKTKSISLNSGKFESHKRYVDIHYLISGKETIGSCGVNKLKVIRDYDEIDDSLLYSIPNEYDKINLKPGEFAVFFPGEGHMPNCHLDKENEIHKIVIKFLIN